MASRAVDALRSERSVLLEICRTLSDAEWNQPSGCPGWSVQDVVAHMGVLFWQVTDPAALPDIGDLPTELAQDCYVRERGSWSATGILDDYADVSERAIDALAGLEGQGFELPLGDLGTYPADLVPNAFVFDHYTHIRADLFSPRGPLERPPPSDGLRLVPALDWIEAAAPQQNSAVLEELGGTVTIDVEGVAGRLMSIGYGDVSVTVTCSAHDLVLWSTQRATWEDLDIEAVGTDDAVGAARHLHVF